MRYAFPSSLVLVCSLLAAPAQAGDAPPDKSRDSLLAPTPDSALRDFSPDRPLIALTPFTVDAGRVQIESDFFNVMQSSDRRTTTRTLQALDPELRIGLTPSLEFDLMTAGLDLDRTTARDTHRTLERDLGTGAVTLQARYNLLGNDGGTYAFALVPILAVPSGDGHFGPQQVEGGVAAPLNIELPSDFTLLLQTEVQALHNDAGAAYASFVNLANLSHKVPGIDKLTASVEFTATVNADRSTPDTATVEAALAYLVTPDTQLDLGGFAGLDRAAPDFQVAAGVAHRF